MSKFIVLTCALLFWAFYEFSGGSEFTPLERKVPIAKAPVAEESVLPEITEITTVALEAAPAPVLQAPKAEEPAYIVIPAPAEPKEAVQQASLDTGGAGPASGDYPIHKVAGEWVNMRDGPSTNYLVLDTLPRGTRAEVMVVNADGWAQIRILNTGQVGWMAERLLSDS